MKFWTGLSRPSSVPLLIPEGFSWGAMVFGPLWLAAHRAWGPAAFALAGYVLIVVLADGVRAGVLALAALLLGVSGNDLRRWWATQRGFVLAQVIAARSEAEALGQWLQREPELARRFLAPGKAP